MAGQPALLEFFLGDRPVYYNNTVEPGELEQNLSFSWTADPEKFYTLILGEMLPRSRSLRSHLLITNIPGQDLARGQTLVPYRPLVADNRRDYVVLLFQQPGLVQSLPMAADRQTVSLPDLYQERFSKVGHLQFRVGSAPALLLPGSKAVDVLAATSTVPLAQTLQLGGPTRAVDFLAAVPPSIPTYRSDAELRSIAEMHQIPLIGSSREALIASLRNWANGLQ